ncbi:MAG: HigA family addiction module antitoxin [Parabacteroides sp.]|nr:HigA family addiction module antitoxin [Parabacteroides sp.]
MGNLGYSFEPTHPGEVIKEELQYRGISQKKFAAITNMSYKILNEILNAKKPVSIEFALLIEASTGINAEMLVNMQTRYNLQVARTDKKNMARFESLRKICASLL